NDTIPPTFTAPANTTIYANVNCSYDASVAVTGDVTNEADNCSTGLQATYTDAVANGNCLGSKIITRTWTLTDACGNAAASQNQIITVLDNIPPTITAQAQNLAVSCDGQGNQSQLQNWLNTNGGATANDNCSTVTWTNNFSPLTNNCSQSVVVIFTATDACGNKATTQATFTVSDTIPPVAPTAPANVTVACSTDIPAMISLTANDNCSGAITVQGQDVSAPGNCPSSYIITRTWTFVDACGNSSSVSQTINVNDTIAPVVPTAPANITVACSTDVPAMISLTANDNCSGAITVQGQDSTVLGNCPGSYIITRTWTFMDACGNSSSVSQTINVNDTVAPVVPTPPANITVACSTDVPAMISLTANDNCSGAITVQGQDSTVQGNCPSSYVITRIWTFVDACGNSSSVSQTINVNDTVPPVVPTAPANITVTCSTDIPAMISLTANDNCSGAITVQGQDTTVPGNCPGSYIITRTWTFMDACGNSSSVSQTINVNDTIPPTFTAPANTTIYANANCSYDASIAVTGDVTNEADNCSTALQATYTDVIADGNCPGSKTITRTWTLTDACGNTAASQNQIITVLDNIPPTITAQAQNLAVSCDGQGNQSQLQNWLNTNGGANANDNCSTVTWTNNFSPLTNNCSQSVVVIFTATDACGNTATTQATFTVSDTIPPVAPTAPANVTVACSTDVPAMISLTANDNCSGAITVQGQDTTVQGNCPNSYIITRTWTFVDACGNSSSVSQTINVNDTVAPIVPTAPESITVACSTDVPAMISLTANDNCSGAITVQGQDSSVPGNCPGSYIITRTWTFMDACGNSSVVPMYRR
ncbi:gliding motility-associated C-terminal domain-containing protein, partial [Flavobacterium sp. 40-81]|uniref:HYR-like domain-containing protein n=1 Tax=Flavobacterium sp. 40-81 TaxID=1896169 RepID=UPI0025800E14